MFNQTDVLWIFYLRDISGRIMRSSANIYLCTIGQANDLHTISGNKIWKTNIDQDLIKPITDFYSKAKKIVRMEEGYMIIS